jgi:hypothetical protein
MAAAECKGIATDTAYAECERRLSQQLADEQLGYIVWSQLNRRPCRRSAAISPRAADCWPRW